MPIYFINGKCQATESREKPLSLFNQSHMVYITPYHTTALLLPLGQTHTPMCEPKNQAPTGHQPTHAWFKTLSALADPITFT